MNRINLSLKRVYQRRMKTSSLMVARSAQFTLVNEHLERTRKQRLSFVFSIVPLGALALLLAGCNSNVHYQGKKVEEDDLSKIKQGMHNKQDVARILGSPSTMSAFGDNTWYFISKTTESTAFLNPNIKEQQVVAVNFDTAGVVQQVAEHDITDGKQVDYVERVTETTGQKRSFMQQVFGNFGRMVRKDDPRGPK